MRYMDFASSCSYCALADLLEGFGVGIDPSGIALEMGLPYLFYYDAGDESFKAGAEQQGAAYFNLFLNPRGFEYEERFFDKKEAAVDFLEGNVNQMIGLLSPRGGKHAYVYRLFSGGVFAFLNPHRKGDEQPDVLTIGEAELLSRLETPVAVGHVSKAGPSSPSPLLYFSSIESLHIYETKIDEFCSGERTQQEISAKRDPLFRPFAVDLLAMAGLLEGKSLEGKLKTFQNQCLSLFKAGDCRPFDVVDRANFLLICQEYEGLISSFLERFRNASSKTAFSFLDSFDSIPGPVVSLRILSKTPQKGEELPFYWYSIVETATGETVGKVSLKVGDGLQAYWGGNVGYEVDEPHRGHRYAYEAAKLLSPLARRHGMESLFISCEDS
jgi:hypothetical protein